MVGTMKRYDPAYERLTELIGDTSDVRLVQVTTLEAPMAPYVGHYPLVAAPAPDPDAIAALRAAEDSALDAAVGDADEETRWCYRWNLLDCLIHEVNALRGALGEPDEVRSAQLHAQCISINLRFGETDCHLSWVDLPGIARYEQTFSFYAPDRRLTLRFPSPFLRSMPTTLIAEGGEVDTADSWIRHEVVAFDEAFKRELVEFADCIATGREPRTSGPDGLGDLRVCEAIVRAHRGAGAAVPVDARATIGARA
jgi:predicted dehydrogenase